MSEATVYFLDAGSRQELQEWFSCFAEALQSIPSLSIMYWNGSFMYIPAADPETDPGHVVKLDTLNFEKDLRGPMKPLPSRMAINVFAKGDMVDLSWWQNPMELVLAEWKRLITSVQNAPESEKAEITAASDASSKLPPLTEVAEVDESPKVGSHEGKEPSGEGLKPLEIPNVSRRLSFSNPFSAASVISSPFQTPLTESVSQLSGYMLKMKHGKSLKRTDGKAGHYKFKPTDWQTRWCVIRGSSLMWYTSNNEYEVLNLVRFEEVLIILPHKDGFAVKEKYSSLDHSRRKSVDSNSSKTSTLSRAKNVVMKLMSKKDSLSRPHTLERNVGYAEKDEDEEDADDDVQEDEDEQIEDEEIMEDSPDEFERSYDMLKASTIAAPSVVQSDCECAFCNYGRRWSESLQKPDHKCCYLEHAPHPNHVPLALFHTMLTSYHETAVKHLKGLGQIKDHQHPHELLPHKLLNDVWANFWTQAGIEGVSLPNVTSTEKFNPWTQTSVQADEQGDLEERQVVAMVHQDEGSTASTRKESRIYPIQIITSKRNYCFACTTYEDMEKWVTALRRAFLMTNILSEEVSQTDDSQI